MREIPYKNIHGVLPKTHDHRDYAVGTVFKMPALAELPTAFTLDGVAGLPPIEDQDPNGYNTDFCSDFGTRALRFFQLGFRLLPVWTFAAKKAELNKVGDFGLELRDIFDAHWNLGCPALTDCDLSMDSHSPDFLRDIRNWPQDLFAKAYKNKAGSYFAVTGPYDHYDNIRATIWLFRNTDKCAVGSGVLWGWPLQQTVMSVPCSQGCGHFIIGIGWDTQGIFVQNSVGLSVGINGRHYFSREVINDAVEKYGAYMFHPMSKDDAQYLNVNNLKVTDNWVVQILKIILNVFGLRKLAGILSTNFK